MYKTYGKEWQKARFLQKNELYTLQSYQKHLYKCIIIYFCHWSQINRSGTCKRAPKATRILIIEGPFLQQTIQISNELFLNFPRSTEQKKRNEKSWKRHRTKRGRGKGKIEFSTRVERCIKKHILVQIWRDRAKNNRRARANSSVLFESRELVRFHYKNRAREIR